MMPWRSMKATHLVRLPPAKTVITGNTVTRSRFLDSLKVLGPETTLRQTARPSAGTCAWITTNTLFETWRDTSKKKVLWISGVPGVGKSTLVRYIVETHRRWLQRHEAPKGSKSSVSFFFCDSKDRYRSNYSDFLSSILYQILSQDGELFRYLSDLDLDEYGSGGGDYQDTVGQESGGGLLWQCLSNILQRSKDTVF